MLPDSNQFLLGSMFFFSEQLQLEDFAREGREITLLAPNEMVEKQKGKPSKKVKFLFFFLPNDLICFVS